MKPDILIVCGATATGKTDCAVDLSRRFDGEVINADSMQVYRGMDIGTAKPTNKQREAIPFHLVDVADPNETFSTGRFKKLADAAIADIHGRGRLPVIAGGTGLYLKALTQGLFEGPEADPALRERLFDQERREPGALHARLIEVDPKKAAALPPSDLGRIVRALEVFTLTGRPLSALQAQHAFAEQPYRSLWIGLELSRDRLAQRIDRRVNGMIDQGWVDEVRNLCTAGFHRQASAANALGYRTLLDHVEGLLSLNEAIEQIQAQTRKFAKRQRTWYRAYKEIRWFSYPDQIEAIFDETAAFVRGGKPGQVDAGSGEGA